MGVAREHGRRCDIRPCGGVVLLALLGCARSVLPLYEERLAAALADPPPLAKDWAPNAVLRLGWPTVDDAMEALVAALGGWGATLRLGPFRVEPAFDVKDARVSAGSCTDCVRLAAHLEGLLHMSGPLGKGTVPASADVDVEIGATLTAEAPGVVAIRLAPRRVHAVDVRLGTLVGGIDGATAAVASWLGQTLTAGIPPFEIARLGDVALPVRGARVGSTADALVVEMATSAPVGAVAPPLGPVDGFELTVANDALVALGARTAFDQGPLDHDVVAEPTGLHVEGTRFRLDLRLWRLVGKGWWRDVSVDGTASLQGRRLHLQPVGAVEVDHSPGAGLVDPIALLLQGTILRAIADAVDRALPATAHEVAHGVRTTVRAESVAGTGPTLQVSGSIAFEAVRSAEARSRDAR
jgi:hypothetical protein